MIDVNVGGLDGEQVCCQKIVEAEAAVSVTKKSREGEQV
jgi:hypothetical protein